MNDKRFISCFGSPTSRERFWTIDKIEVLRNPFVWNGFIVPPGFVPEKLVAYDAGNSWNGSAVVIARPIMNRGAASPDAFTHTGGISLPFDPTHNTFPRAGVYRSEGPGQDDAQALPPFCEFGSVQGMTQSPEGYLHETAVARPSQNLPSIRAVFGHEMHLVQDWARS